MQQFKEAKPPIAVSISTSCQQFFRLLSFVIGLCSNRDIKLLDARYEKRLEAASKSQARSSNGCLSPTDDVCTGSGRAAGTPDITREGLGGCKGHAAGPFQNQELGTTGESLKPERE